MTSITFFFLTGKTTRAITWKIVFSFGFMLHGCSSRLLWTATVILTLWRMVLGMGITIQWRKKTLQMPKKKPSEKKSLVSYLLFPPSNSIRRLQRRFILRTYTVLNTVLSHRRPLLTFSCYLYNLLGWGFVFVIFIILIRKFKINVSFHCSL